MSKSIKSFGSATTEEVENLEFEIYGEKFEVKSAISGMIFLELQAKLAELIEEDESKKDEGGSNRSNLESVRMMLNYITRSMATAEEAQRFKEWARDEDSLTSDDVNELYMWLIQNHTARPTK